MGIPEGSEVAAGGAESSALAHTANVAASAKKSPARFLENITRKRSVEIGSTLGARIWGERYERGRFEPLREGVYIGLLRTRAHACGDDELSKSQASDVSLLHPRQLPISRSPLRQYVPLNENSSSPSVRIRVLRLFPQRMAVLTSEIR